MHGVLAKGHTAPSLASGRSLEVHAHPLEVLCGWLILCPHKGKHYPHLSGRIGSRTSTLKQRTDLETPSTVRAERFQSSLLLSVAWNLLRQSRDRHLIGWSSADFLLNTHWVSWQHCPSSGTTIQTPCSLSTSNYLYRLICTVSTHAINARAVSIAFRHWSSSIKIIYLKLVAL
jgi:hypothetical protein